MNFKNHKSSLFILAFMLLIFTNANGQTTIYNNFGEDHSGWNYTYTTGWTISGYDVAAQYGVEQAMGFDSDTEGILADIWLAISYVPLSSDPDTVIIRLCRNPDELPPDTANIMEEWTLTTFQSWSQWNTPIHLEGNGTSLIQAGHSYWLWAIGKETTWCMWCLNEDPAFTAPHTIRREDEDWLSISNETASAFRVDIDIDTYISDPGTHSQDHLLSQNFPNPFSQSTNISYSVKSPNYVSLKVYDLYGKEIQTLADNFHPKGSYSLQLDASDLPAGVYFCRLQIGDSFSEIIKMSHFD